MDFSEVISNVQNAIFSPDNSLVALTNGTKVIIKNASQLTNIQIFTFPDLITNFEFSPDSQYLLVCMGKKNAIEARAIYEEDWSCKIEDPVLGLLYARWSPDSRHILTFSDYQMRLSVYSLVDKSIHYIKHPKFIDKGISFTSDGKFMALAERKDTKDYIGIYYVPEWKLVNYIQSESFDLQDIKFSPDNSVIMVADSSLEYKFMIYCPAQGLLNKYSAYDYALGIKSFKFSENSSFLAVGSYDEKVRVFNTLTWKNITEFEHKSSLTETVDILIFKEEEIKELFPYQVDPQKVATKYVMVDGPLKLPSIKAQNDKPNPQQGVGSLAWSPDSAYLVTKNDNMPNVLWIWDMTSLSLKVVLIQLQPIKSFTWCDNSEYLVFSTGSGRVFFWSKDGASVCDVPFGKKEGVCNFVEGKNFGVSRVEWSKDGSTMLLFDKNELVIAYPPGEFLLRGNTEAGKGGFDYE